MVNRNLIRSLESDPELKAVFHAYEVQGNPWGLPAPG